MIKLILRCNSLYYVLGEDIKSFYEGKSEWVNYATSSERKCYVYMKLVDGTLLTLNMPIEDVVTAYNKYFEDRN